MKGKFLALTVGAMALAAIGATSAVAGQPDTKGNGLPRVSMKDSWQLNINATDNCPTASFDDSNRRTIVVQAVLDVDAENANRPAPDSSDLNNIELASWDSDSFQIVDGNACDNDPAQILMPTLVASWYDVWVRFRGAPNTKLDPTLCGYDQQTDTTWCNTTTVFEVQKGQDKQGNIKFHDYTSTLLGIPDTLDICSGNVCDLFDPALEGWFWDWTASNGAKATVVFIKCDASKGGHDTDPSLRNCGETS